MAISITSNVNVVKSLATKVTNLPNMITSQLLDYTFIARPDREVHEDEVPKCRCEDKETKEKINAKVRPNILFNNDPSFNTRLSDMQEGHFKEFVK